MGLLGEIMVRFSADTLGFTTGSGAVVAALAGVGAAIGASVKVAGDYEQSITKLYTTAGEAKGNLQMVGDGILKMSSDVGTSAQTLAQGMYWIESGGGRAAIGLDDLRIAAQAAKAENANLDDVARSLMATLNAYKGTGLTAAEAMNTLVASTGQGMMTLQELSTSLASVLPASAKFGISLTDVGAAMATMTMQGDPAAQAATHLKQMILALEAPSKIGAAALKSVGLSSQEVSDEMRKSLPGAIQMITDAVGKKFPEGSAAYNQAIKNIAGGSKQMMGFLELAGKHLQDFSHNVDVVSGAVKKGGDNIMGWSDIQQNFNFKMDTAKATVERFGITLGTELLPIFGKLLGQITPIITGFINWESKTHTIQNAISSLVGGVSGIITALSNFAGLLNRSEPAMDLFKSILTAFALVVAPLVVFALSSLAVATWAAIVPMLPFVLMIGVLSLAIFGLILLIRNWGGIMDWLTGKTKQATLEQGQSQEKARIKAITESELQKTGVLKNLEDERKQLAEKIKGMADNSEKSRAQIRLTALDNQIRTTKGNITELDKEKAAHLKTLKDLESQDPQIREKTKLAAIKVQVEQKNGVLKELDDEKAKLIAKITEEKDGSAKTRDLMKLDAINKQLDLTTGTLKALNYEYTGHMDKLNKLKADDLEARKNWYDRANDAFTVWVNDQTRKLDNMIKSWGVGLQRWGDDTLSRFGSMVGGWMSGMGTWVSGTLGNLGQMIGGWISGLGTLTSNITSWCGQTIGGWMSWLGTLVHNTASWFGQLPGIIMNALANAASAAFSGGANIVMGVANGIYSAIGNAVAAAQSLAAQVAAFLPHSPAKQGPLKDLNLFGPSLVQGFASGIDKSHPIIKASMEHLLTPIGGRTMSVSGTGQSPSGSNGTQTIILQIDGREMAKALGPHLTNEIRLVAQVRR